MRLHWHRSRSPDTRLAGSGCLDVWMARRWATSGTSVLFTSQVPAFSFVPEQFWGRAARASNDSQESGRLLIFEGLCDRKGEEDLAARLKSPIARSRARLLPLIFPHPLRFCQSASLDRLFDFLLARARLQIKL